MIRGQAYRLAAEDYQWAVRKASWRNWLHFLTRTNNDLLAFDQVRRQLTFVGQHSLGLQIVCVDKIVGSAGRTRDFDRAFLPRQTSTKDRWININQAYYDQKLLPPVELFKIEERYFVIDGHHRVSVARTHGQHYMDAYVTEIDTLPATAAPCGQVALAGC